MAKPATLAPTHLHALLDSTFGEVDLTRENEGWRGTITLEVKSTYGGKPRSLDAAKFALIQGLREAIEVIDPGARNDALRIGWLADGSNRLEDVLRCVNDGRTIREAIDFFMDTTR